MPPQFLTRNAVTFAVVLGCFAMFGDVSLASQPNADSVTGRWERNDGATKILISQNGARLIAVNTWVKDPAGREQVGDELILDLHEISTSVFQGEAYDVRRQRNYKMTLEVAGSSMKTTGCILMGILCKSARWTRVN